MIRQVTKFNAFIGPVCRKFSSTPVQNNLVELSVDDKSGYAIVSLNRPPVNSLNLDLLSALSKSLDDVLDNRSRGMILTSTAPTTFSAGLDIMEMYKPDKERARQFWTTLQDVWLKLYGCPFPTAAAINGHSPAGGCLLAMSCEYRVMAKNFVIGLNETQLGIVAPSWFQTTMKNTIGFRQAEQALTMGTLFKTDEALKIGLVDEMVENKDEAIRQCTVWLDKFKKIPPLARGLSKQSFRSKAIQALEDNRSQDTEQFLFFLEQPKVQQGMGAYVEALKAKKSG